MDKIIQATHHAEQEEKAEWVIFSEMALTGYPPEDLLLREDFLALVEEGLATLCKALPHSKLIVGFPQRTPEGLYNALAVIESGEIKTIGQKQHLPNYGVFDEKRYFKAGEKSTIVDLSGIKTALLICEDIWNEKPLQEAVAAGAEMAIILNASPFSQQKPEERKTVLRTRTAQEAVPIVYVHCIGGQDELVFDGGSFVMNAAGEIMQQAPFFEEALMTVECFRDTSTKLCFTKKNLPPRSSPEERLYRALVLATRDYVRKNGFQGALLGLSGGIDSALTLAIAVDALGAEHVKAVLMPSRYTAAMSNEEAIKQAQDQGVAYTILPIEPMFEAALTTLEKEFTGLAPNVAEENLQARIRGMLLMSLSNKTGQIVLTTGNKSEMAVGYTTLYGDMAGGFAVLKDIYKTQVYKLAQYRNSLSLVIPERVIERAPTAELAQNQKDEDSLPPYAILDQILTRYIELDGSVSQMVAAGFDVDTVKRVVQLVDRNEYKRRQSPPGPRVTGRAFGRDRRYPITSGFYP